ncbi:MAG: hypothetical protein IJS12_06385 [Lachnospiraceae bacterium]|nr:hypothetical protein [Lachnospiraceae bacterium]
MNINFDTEYQMSPLTSGDRPQNGNVNIQVNRAAENAAGFLVSAGIAGDMPFAGADKEPVSDLAAGLSATDVQLKTDYMAVMSLSMSDEDYNELVRTGQIPDDMDAGDSVTILDDIKAALIKGGADISGFTDTIDEDTLAQITGSATSASNLLKKAADSGINADELIRNMQKEDISISAERISDITGAVDLAMEVLPLSDDAAVYMIDNGKSPTVENIYNASNAGSLEAMGGRRYYAEDGYVSLAGAAGSQADDLEALRPQIEETIRRAGLEVNEDTYSDAKLLISHNIPFTPETLLELDQLKELRTEPDPDRLAASVSIAISAGIRGSKANLTYDESIYIRADEYLETINTIPAETADRLVEDGRVLNIRNLQREYEYAKHAGNISKTETETETITGGTGLPELTTEQIHARRVLEEARISMTVEANRMLLKNNFRIDIAPMEELVEALKAAEQAIAKRLFPSEEDAVSGNRMETYRQVKTEIAQLPGMPAAILGQYGSTGRLQFGAGERFTLHAVYETGSVRRDAYIRAEETYEALMTAPRRDMGDSISKAFRNVDDILEDLQLEVNDLNRRAVRILGYNSTEITSEKIEQVREADLSLRGVLNRLTPDRVLNMIRQDVNPLNMPIQELSDYLDGQDADPERQASDYARFLMQLERRGEITELERDSYIGIYRMLSKLDRNDDAAVGRLMAMGAEMSFSGLLSAMRSAARSGMDYSIGADFGGVDPLRSGTAIDAQISAAFTSGQYAEGVHAGETVIENLLMMGEKASLGNLDAMKALRTRRGDWFKPVAERMVQAEGGDEDESGIEGALKNVTDMTDDVLDHMTDADETVKAYTEMLDKVKTDLTDMVYEADKYLDVRSLRTGMKQVNILNRLARDEIYDLPAEIDGEYTSIRLTIRHESGAGRVAVSMATESVGMIAAEFSFSGETSGYIAYEQSDAATRLGELMGRFEEMLGFTPEMVRTDRINPDKYTDGIFNNEKARNRLKENNDPSDINNIELYRVARSFISILKDI